MRRLRTDDGVAVLETAFLLPILLMLSVVAVEFGFAFVDWLAVSNSTRTAARVAASAGDDPMADAFITDAIEEAMAEAPRAAIDTIEIFQVLSDGSQGPTNTYVNIAGSWSCTFCAYPATSRSTSLNSLHTIGVRVNFTHDWVVDFWSATAPNWSDQEIIRLEPNIQGS
jgi:Flp pilus assembly protein TadG